MKDGPNRRAEERFPFNADASCPHLSPVAEDFGPVRLKDVSMGGIGMLLSRAVEVGALLAVTLVNPAKGFTKTVLVRVTHASRVGGNYVVGGAFTTPLTYQEMTTLVL